MNEIIINYHQSLTVDEFDSETLASAWEWNTPEAGPTWSLTENPGFFQFMVPAGRTLGRNKLRAHPAPCGYWQQ